MHSEFFRTAKLLSVEIGNDIPKVIAFCVLQATFIGLIPCSLVLDCECQLKRQRYTFY